MVEYETTFDIHNDRTCIYWTFIKIEPFGLRNGWGRCRLIRIRRVYYPDNHDDDITETITEYDPAIHDDTSHYMSTFYTYRQGKFYHLSEWDSIKIYGIQDTPIYATPREGVARPMFGNPRDYSFYERLPQPAID